MSLLAAGYEAHDSFPLQIHFKMSTMKQDAMKFHPEKTLLFEHTLSSSEDAPGTFMHCIHCC